MFCPYCGKDAGDAKFCPNCGKPLTTQPAQPQQPVQQPMQQQQYPNPVRTKKKRHTGAKVCLGLLGVIILGTIIVNSIGGSNSAPVAKSVAQGKGTSAMSSAVVSSAPSKTESAAPIGQEVGNDKVTIKVNSATEAKEISDDSGYLSYKPGAGAKYVLINITAKNIGKSSYSFVVNNFQLDGKDGKQYSPSIMVAQNYLNSGSMNPGLTETGNIAFEVPQNMKLSDLTMRFQEFLSLSSNSFMISK